MKKIVLVCLILGLCAPISFAMPGGTIPYGPSAKYAGMGGAGSALVGDLTAAFYNPAGMAKAQSAAIKIGAGTATEGMDKLLGAFAQMSNPAKFLADNFANAINVNGNLNLLIGARIAKVGLTVIPVSGLNLTKAANTLGGTINAGVNMDAALTLVYGASLPYVGFMNFGANIKSITNAMGSSAVGVAGPLTTDITNTVNTYSGMGYDLGAQGQIDAIPTAPISFGIVYKDLGATLNGHTKVTKGTYSNTTGAQIGSDTTLVDADIAGYALPTTLVLGAAGTIPVVGVKLAVDIDSVNGSGVAYSVTHMGVEYPVAMGLVKLRAGTISGGAGNSISMTTLGAGLMGDSLNIAMISDTKNSKNNQYVFDFGFGF